MAKAIGQESFMQLNIRSARNKKNELSLLLLQAQPNLVSLCEHWFMDDEIQNFTLDNYVLVNSFCRKDIKGGGVAIFAKTGIPMRPVNFKLPCIVKDFEYACATTTIQGKKTLYISMYRSPCGNIKIFLSQLELLLKQAINKYVYVYLGGDFNIDLLTNDATSKQLLDLLGSYNLTQTVDEPSRISAGSATLIDNIFTNFTSTPISVLQVTDLSDHLAIILILPYYHSGKEDKFIIKRMYSDQNKIKFYELLSNSDWGNVYIATTANKKYNEFFKIISVSFELAFPLKKIKLQNKDNKSWVTPEIINESERLKAIHWLYSLTGNEEIKQRYSALKNYHKKTIVEAKKSHNQNILANSHNISKSTWNLIKKETTNNCENEFVINTNGVEINDLNKISQQFNQFFIESVEKTIPAAVPYVNKLSKIANHNFFLMPVDTVELVELIKSCTKKQSEGPDGIPCTVIGNVANLIVEPLAHIINQSFLEGVFPDKLKEGKCIPLHKKGSKDNLDNYRPLCLQSVFSKIFERAMFNRLTSYVNKFKLISNTQHGFRQGKSTTSALFDTLSSIMNAIDKQSQTIGIYFDLSKAFDIINHDILLKKLQNYGIRGVALQWIESYLTGRCQYVQLTGKVGNVYNSKVKSDLLKNKHGVPQGGILSPLLFLLFCNDLNNHFQSIQGVDVCQFADDTSFIVRGSNENTLATLSNEVTNGMWDWCVQNGLLLNPKKTVIVQFTNTCSRANLSSLLVRLQNRSICVAEHTRFLGVEVDNHLTWNHHINNVAGKLKCAHYAISMLKNSLNLHSVLLFYYASVHSHLNYAIIAWGSSSETNRLFILQKRIVRLIADAKYLEHCSPLFKKLGIMTVYSLYLYNLALFVKMNSQYFLTNGMLNDITVTRYVNRLSVPRHRTALFEKGPHYMAIKTYNHLPSYLHSIQNQIKFKKELKLYFTNHVYYSTDEYFDNRI